MISIIGAGPVGLYTALHLSLSDQVQITVYEKRSEYTRQQTVLFRGIRIKLCDLETQFKAACLNRPNIKFVEKEILELKEIPDSVVIVANGARSKFRGEELRRNKQHFLALNIKIHSKDKISTFTTSDLYCFLKLMEQPGFESEGGNMTFILQVEDESVVGKFTTSTCPPQYLKYVQAYCRSKGSVEESNVGITTYSLSTQIAKRMVFRREGKLCFLVGDAAVSLPFFRGVSFGLKSAEALVYCLYKNKIDYYQRQVEAWTQDEVRRSEEIEKFLHLFQLYLFVSNHVSWQVITWPKELEEYVRFGVTF